MFVYFLFFFKQKTAYEMRISDWSSDVCSSDLQRTDAPPPWPETITPALRLAETPFSRRTRKLLAQSDYATLGDMLACDRTELVRDLLSLPNGCRRVLNEVEAMLARLEPSPDVPSRDNPHRRATARTRATNPTRGPRARFPAMSWKRKWPTFS